MQGTIVITYKIVTWRSQPGVGAGTALHAEARGRRQQTWHIEPSTVRFDSVRLGSIESNRGFLFDRSSRTGPLFGSKDFCLSSVRLD